MKKEINIAIAVLFGFLAFLYLERPLRIFLSCLITDEMIAKQLSGIIVRITLIGMAYGLMKKLNLIDFSGLKNWRKVKNVQAALVAFLFVSMGITSSWSTYSNTAAELVLLFLISTIAVGIVEEFAFRGLVFPLFIKSFSKLNRPLLWSAVLSSLLFGLVHFVNLFKAPENVVGITSQVFFATSIGVFFCGLMVRTENILIPCIIHALVNFGFGSGELQPVIEEIAKTEEASGVKWSSIIPTTIFFVFIFSGGIFMILKADKQEILEKLRN